MAGRLFSGTPTWVLRDPVTLTPASVHFDFVNNRYYQAAPVIARTPGNLLTASRASDGYISNVAGSWNSIPVNVARITDRGLAAQEARTNGIRNNSAQGAVSGEPGTLPTYWFRSFNNNAGTLAHAVVGTGVEDGLDYIDLRMYGTPTGAGYFYLALDSAVGIVASPSDTWTASLFVRRSAGTTANLGLHQTAIADYTAAGAFVSGGNQTASIAGTTLGLSRAVQTRTLSSDVTVARVLSSFIANYVAGPVDITYRISMPQLELGTFATSPIRTTSAAVTRAADVITLTNMPIFGPAFTLFAKGAPSAPVAFTSSQYLLSVDTGANTDRASLRRLSATGNANLSVAVGGVETGTASGAVWSQITSGKLAGAFASLDQAASFNGGAIFSAAGAMPTPLSAVRIGSNGSSTLQFDGYLEQIAIWPSLRLSNAALQAITT